MKDKPGIGFFLNQITTEQFAIVEEAYSENSEVINISAALRFGADTENKVIGIYSLFKFEIEKVPFIIIEVGCHFRIEEDAWQELAINTNENEYKFPRDFIRHLAVITIGTARGVLHAKTESTAFSKYILPTIDVTELVEDDVILSASE